MDTDKIIHIKFLAALATLLALTFWGMSHLMLVE
jgi:hypothetical protein